ncbi:MAG: hypothetical protein WBQ18_12970 [Solirubrobacteraceae bacterium]
MRVTVLAAVLAAAFPGIAQARWSHSFDFAPPGTLDVQGVRLALSPSGAAAAAFGIQDVDVPGSAQADVTLRSSQGTVGQPAPVSGAAQILAAAYDRGDLALLTGTAGTGQICCSNAQATTVGADGRQSAPQTLVGGLAGPALGQLVALADGHVIAAVATERGVWVMQAGSRGRFGAQHLLTLGGKMPETLAATRAGANGTVLAWTAATGIPGTADPRTISVAEGVRGAAPRRVRTAITVPAGHRVDELGIAARGATETLTWIESWFDRSGAYHAVVRAADLVPHAATRTLSPGGSVAAGLQFAGDPTGDQTIVWQSCASSGACAVRMASRTAHGTFGGSRVLGAADPTQAPALAVGTGGQALAGWTLGGHPTVAVRRGASGRFGSAVKLSPTLYAHDVAVAVGTRGRALAGWTQGTLNPSVVGALYTP